MCCQGCNTLCNIKVIDIEILEPGKIILPANYKKVAIRYNNCNVAPHPFYGTSFFNGSAIKDEANTDSLASKIYYDCFFESLYKQNYFDSIIEISPADYSSTAVIDTITHSFIFGSDSIILTQELAEKINVFHFSQTLKEHPNTEHNFTQTKYLHPRFGLYTPEDISNIADSTGADFLISLDFFSSIDGVYFNRNNLVATEAVPTQAYWNFYDLKNQTFPFALNKKDTLSWSEIAYRLKQLDEILPPRKDAVLNAADMAGTQFAYFLAPHWIPVQRMYYSSGHVELKKAEELINQGNWLEAAKIWKANANNPNKAIAAKSKYNLGLACELQGKIDAALDWIVKSYHVLGQNNEEHASNCMNYITILGLRKHDTKMLNTQFQEADEHPEFDY